MQHIFSGVCLFVCSNIPSGQKLGSSLALVTSLVLALMTHHQSSNDKMIVIPASEDSLIERIIGMMEKLGEEGAFNKQKAKLALYAYFKSRADSIHYWEGPPEKGGCVSKVFSEPPGLLYMETVPGSSRIKENLQRVKSLLEYRLFLHALGIQDFGRFNDISEVLKVFEYSIEDLVNMLGQNYDNKMYTKKEIEETMDIALISLVRDVPYASQVLESIFSLHPFQTTTEFIELYRMSNQVFEVLGCDQNSVDSKEFHDSMNDIFQFYLRSKLIPSKSATDLINFVMKIADYNSFFFTSRLFCKGLGVLMNKSLVAETRKAIIEEYFGKNQEKMVMFDDMERQVLMSSISTGVAFFDLETQVWFH